MSRAKRNEVGVNVVCDHHPDVVLFYPRLSIDPPVTGPWTVREAGPRSVRRGFIYADRKYARRCTRTGCRVHLEYQGWKICAVLEMMQRSGGPGISVLTGREMGQMVNVAAAWKLLDTASWPTPP
jgi:hypothetical protein